MTLTRILSGSYTTNWCKKTKHKPSVEGAVGDVATAIIAKLRNDNFTSLSGLNAGILRALEAFNDKPFQKRFGSRNLIFENEESKRTIIRRIYKSKSNAIIKSN